MLNENDYKYRLTKAINRLPIKDQNNFKKALCNTKLKNELFIPHNFTHRHITPSKRPCMRNVLIKFNDKYNKDKQLLQTIRKETNVISENFDTMNKAVGFSNREQLYGELVDKYKDKGYDENMLLPKDNIFNQSILLREPKYFDNVHLVGNEEENKDDRLYIYNTHWYIDKKGGSVKPPPHIDSDDDDDNDNVKGFHKKGVLSLPQVEISNNLLQKDITHIESLINDTNKNELQLHTSLGLSTACEYKRINPTCYNKNKHIRGGSKTNRHNIFRRGVNVDDNSDNNNNNVHMKVVTDDVFLSSKGMKREIKVPHVKLRQRLKIENKNTYNRCNTFLNINSLKHKHTLKTKSDNVLKKVAKKIIIKTPSKPVNDALSERELLYNRLSRNSLSETEDSLIRFLEKTQKGSYEKVNYSVGSNLHGFVSDFERKTKAKNLPELLHQLKLKTGDYEVKEENMLKVKQIDERIRNIQYKYANDILTAHKY